MKKIISKIKKNKILIILIVILILKMIIVQVQPLNAKYTMKYDDQLMIEMAENIVDGKWLGEYNSKTLIKGVFTPLFISLMYILNIPFLLGKAIFYGIACIVLVMVLKNKIKSEVVLVVTYTILLFNPLEYSAELSRAYRDGIYMSLIMYFLSFFIGIIFSRKEKIKKQMKYFVGLGISFSAIYLCREETIWLLPFIIFIIICTVIPIIIDKNLKDKSKRIALYNIPLMILFISTNLICILNYKYYGVYTLNQYWGEDFKSVYGALTRVEPEEEKEKIPVAIETLEELYQYSPKLAELQNYFNSSEANGWKMCGEKVSGEINGGYFHWALMEAVESQGYYKEAKMADNYYKELGKEINNLCEKGIVRSKGAKRISNICYFKTGDIIKVIKNISKTIKFQYKLTDVKMTVSNSVNAIGVEDKEEKIQKMEKMTHHKIETVSHYVSTWNNFRLKIIEKIKEIYAFINKYFVWMSIMAFIVWILSNIKELNRIYEELVILVGLLILYFTRIFIITFTTTLMFEEALNTSYLACIYNIQYLFSIIAILFLIKDLRSRYNERRNRINNINSSSK